MPQIIAVVTSKRLWFAKKTVAQGKYGLLQPNGLFLVRHGSHEKAGRGYSQHQWTLWVARHPGGVALGRVSPVVAARALDHSRAAFHAIARDVCRALGGGLLLKARLDLVQHADGVDTVRREAVSLDGAAHFIQAVLVGGEF